ncbi:MAG: DUF262 domain-containing protein [Planctomycetota bacterium]
MAPDVDSEEADSDSETGPTFPPAERKVVTQPLDLSVQTLVDQWNAKELLLPEIQREYVWDNKRASRLVESLLLNIPIPVLYFAETEDAKFEIIDGHQRVRSVVRYLNNEFPLGGLQVLSEYKGKRYHTLPAREQRFLKMRTLRAVVISYESHPSMKFEIFERLNTGSISLNPQELRNSIYRGRFNRELHTLAKNEELRKIVGTRSPRRRMVDEELILRFLALRANFEDYKPPLKRYLNNYMQAVQCADEDQVEEAAQIFRETITVLHATLGDGAFRLADRTGEPTEKAINRALFDSQMLAFSWVTKEPTASQRKKVLKELASLYKDPEFLDTIRRATGDRTRTRRRVGRVVEALESAGLTLDVPVDLSSE